ncbi:MAG: MATE family efflux transporter [Phycisphaerales bacterium]
MSEVNEPTSVDRSVALVEGAQTGAGLDDQTEQTTQHASQPQKDQGGISIDDSAHALSEMLAIALPSVATMASYTIMQFVDKLMVKEIGPDPVYVAAQSNGGMMAWMMMSFILGLTGVINSFVSQNLGAGTPERGAAYAWNGIWIGTAYWILFLVPCAYFVPAVFERVHEGNLLVLETQYAKVIMLGAIGTILSRGLHHYFYGMHRPKVVLVSAICGNITNIFLNWVLIFGNLGAPELGLIGAGIGTVAGGLVEFAIPFVLFLSPKYAIQYGTRKAWKLSKDCIKGLVKVGMAPGLMFVNEMACWALLMAWLVPLGGEAIGDDPVWHNTTGWIALQYMHLSFMPAVGLSIATQAVVGKAMGMKRPDIAMARTKLALFVTMGYMGLCALVFVIFREELIGLFINAETPPELREKLIDIGAKVMIAAAVFQVFDAMAITTSAALRGAGDTVWPGVATIVLSWVCIIGVGFGLVTYVPSLGSIGPWIGASLFIICLGIALSFRFLGGKWKTMTLVDEDSEPDLDPFDDLYADPTLTGS